MATNVDLMRAVSLFAHRIALGLKVHRQSVDRILRRPHVAAMVDDFRTRLRADQFLRDGTSEGVGIGIPGPFSSENEDAG